jgi:alkanesulfonate monooxygenase SsuD/methylene tetrahydromethanopterin reductase-like flavin-dependent oxidoreductase (luciferase family)
VQAGGPPILIAANSPDSLARSARLADGINPFFFNRDAFKQMLAGYRQLVAAAGRDPRQQLIVVRANAKVTDTPLEQRAPLNGSLDQVLDDLRWLRDLDVSTVFFDMNMQHVPIDDQLRHLEALQRGLAAG